MQKKIIYLFMIISAIVVILELGLHAVNFTLHYGEEKTIFDNRHLLSPYKGEPWAREMYEEYDELTGGYKEFRGWGKDEYHGKYVNIDSNGVRKTWNPENYKGKSTESLYVFGPSNIWGYGARDSYTIPSYISKLLNSKGYAFEVYNYGEWGYAFNQELVYLIMLLRDGHRPDYVMFYGWGDIYNAYQVGHPGTLHWNFSLTSNIKEHTPWEHLTAGVKGFIRDYSMIYKELSKVKKKFDPPASIFAEAGHTYSDDELMALVKETADYQKGSFELLEKLSKSYGFKYMVFWMPMIFTEDKLTDEEAKVDPRLKDEALTKIYKFADKVYKNGLTPHFYNITDVLKERTKTYYLDIGHLSEEGNGVVAKKLVELFEKEYLIYE